MHRQRRHPTSSDRSVSYTHLLLGAHLTRWILAIQEYQFEIQYCEAKDNLVADVLSRNQPSENNMETGNIKYSSNDIGIYAVKHITKPEVVRRLKDCLLYTSRCV